MMSGAVEFATAHDPPETSDQLSEFRDLVGEWKGVGQPRRGSSRDAWQEDIEWKFNFEDGVASLECASKGSRWMKEATLRELPGEGEFKLVMGAAEHADARSYHGKKNEIGALVLSAEKPVSGTPDRITLRLVADGDRLVVLYESRGGGDRYSRIAEVGYTRKGANFAQESYPECIVTGGRGTIPVEHNGKTYYVCCSGCRELFVESPDKIIAEYERKKNDTGNQDSK